MAVIHYAVCVQIITPHDKNISQAIKENLSPWPQSWDLSVLKASPLHSDPYDKIFTSYFQDLKSLSYYK